jgi:hypothetical protein
MSSHPNDTNPMKACRNFLAAGRDVTATDSLDLAVQLGV